MKAVSYSLFGWGRDKHRDCFDFISFLRSMHVCLRFNRIIYPGWEVVVNIDDVTYNSPYKKIFQWHEKKGFIRFNICPDNEKLCKAMLWRLKTVFEMDGSNWKYSHIICRDLDSISTYREAQMVQEWINEDKALHCITDSISHTIPLMGGLVGFRPGYVNDIMRITDDPGKAWIHLMDMANDIDYSRKGADQDFMNRIMYPKLCQSSTDHFIKGMPHNLVEGNGRHYSVNESIDIGVDPKYKTTNLFCGHAGASGFYEFPTMKFLYYEDPFKEEYEELETMKEFDKIFYWSYREDLR